VTQLTDQGFRTQQWEFLAGSLPDTFKVRQRSNGGCLLCLQVENDSLAESSRIVAASRTSASSDWGVRNLPFPIGTYTLINARSGKAVTSISNAEGAQLVQKTFGSTGQSLKDGTTFVIP
jgi:Ricin-type beta-trefoil lectin domain-like